MSDLKNHHHHKAVKLKSNNKSTLNYSPKLTHKNN